MHADKSNIFVACHIISALPGTLADLVGRTLADAFNTEPHCKRKPIGILDNVSTGVFPRPCPINVGQNVKVIRKVYYTTIRNIY